jgi:hypothetical protein
MEEMGARDSPRLSLRRTARAPRDRGEKSRDAPKSLAKVMVPSRQ